MTETFVLRVLHQGWNRFGLATLRLRDGTMVERALEDHGAAVCVLPYDPQRSTAVLVRQMRVGPSFWGEPGEIDEAPAGGLDGEHPEAAARREVLEETGLAIGALEPVATPYSMPSVSSERLYLFLAPYLSGDRVGQGGGLREEGEDISVHEIPLADLARRAACGQVNDLKTLVLIQALQIRRPELFL